jgi:hypothetical protein
MSLKVSGIRCVRKQRLQQGTGHHTEVTSKGMIGSSLMHVLVIYMHVRTLTDPYDTIAMSKME